MKKNNLAFTANKGLTFVKRTDVLYCCSDGAYTHIYLESGKKITVSKNLKEVQTKLKDALFIRIHASYLINLEHTIGYLNNKYNCVKMSNGEELNVARSRKQELMDCFTRI